MCPFTDAGVFLTWARELFPQPEATFAPCRTTATTRGLWKVPRGPPSPSARASGSGRAPPRGRTRGSVSN